MGPQHLHAAVFSLALALAAAAAAPRGDHVLGAEFDANATLVNQPVLCSPDEHSCLSLGLLYDPHGQQCLPLGYTRRSSDCVYAARRCDFDQGAGRLQAVCLSRSECLSLSGAVERPLAWSGRCAPRGAECSCGGEPSGLHLFGGAECLCGRRPAPRLVLQPLEPGRCNAPDFTRDLHGPEAPTGGAPVRLRCPHHQRLCNASEGQVWYRGACRALLAQGPCDEGFVVALTRRSGDGRRFAECARADGGCQSGRQRFAADARHCHPSKLFAGPDAPRLRRDARGLWRLSFRDAHRHHPSAAPPFECTAYEDAPKQQQRRRGGRERPCAGTTRARARKRKEATAGARRKGKGKGNAKGKGKGKPTATTPRPGGRA